MALDLGRGTRQTPDLSGTWQLDADASRIAARLLRGGGNGGPADTLHITHAANGTLVVGNRVNAAKAWTYRPGAESKVPVGPNATLTVTSRWEGQQFVAEGSQAPTGADALVRLREVFALSGDGDTLTIDVTAATPNGETTSRLVYRRVGG